MGLDISVYKNIDFDSFKDRGGMTEEEIDDSFDNMLYLYAFDTDYNQTDDIKPGFYNDPQRTLSFRAGSYSGYNIFRSILCQSFFGFKPEKIWENPENYTGQDFVELINFSDCEGFIGYKTSQKLYNDFIKNKDKFVKYLENECFEENSKLYYIDKYDEWTEAFQVASEQGVVVFS